MLWFGVQCPITLSQRCNNVCTNKPIKHGKLYMLIHSSKNKIATVLVTA